MYNEVDGVPYHKTKINVPLDLFLEMKRDAKVLGINFNALLLIKLNKLKEQDNALDSLKIISEAITSNMNKKQLDKIFEGHTKKDTK